MGTISLADIAEHIGGRCEGDGSIIVSGLSEPATATADQLAVAMDPRFLPALAEGQAIAAVLPEGQEWQALGLRGAIFVGRPRLAMAKLTSAFRNSTKVTAVVHTTAVIDPAAQIGQNCTIAAHVVIEAGAVIGDNATIGPGTWIGPGVQIGGDAQIAANVSICPGVAIGDAFVCHPGVTLGGDGFSFVTAGKSAVETVRETLGEAGETEPQSWIKIHSLGGVHIGDRVEVGANSSVDAGTIRPTRIGDGTKLDALVQVGHNAVVGRNCLLCAHVAVGGSAIVGDNSVLGGQVGVADNITLGDGVIAGGATKILSNVPAGRALLGYPAMKIETHVETYKALRRLPKLFSRVAGLEKASKDRGQSDDDG